MVTAGRYYFALSDTPVLDQDHIFGSLNWDRGQVEDEPPLGEVLDQPRRWYAGTPQGRRALPRIIGNVDCLRDGAEYPPVYTPGRQTIYGLDVRCFPVPRTCRIQRLDQWRIDDPALLLICAKLVDFLYWSFGDFRELAEAFFGDDSTVSIHPGGDTPLPTSASIQTANYNVIVIAGTQGNDRLFLQLMQASTELRDTGQYTTLPIWDDAHNAVHQRGIDDGLDGTKPVLIIGHSYGAAVAYILAARYHFFNVHLLKKLVTFGMPKPGDNRLCSLAFHVERIHVVTNDDPAPSVPPSSADLGAFIAVVPAISLFKWNTMRRPGRQYYLTRDGRLVANEQSTFDHETLSQAITYFLDGSPFPEWANHYSSEYVRRLQSGQPVGAPCPVPAPIMVMIEGPDFADAALWLQPDTLQLYADGDTLPVWKDQSGNGYDLHATPPFGPTVAKAQAAGWPAARFAATSYLRNNAATLPLGNAHTIFVVGNPPNGIDRYGPWLLGADVGHFESLPEVSWPAIKYRDTAAEVTALPVTDSGKAALWTVLREPTRVRMWMNGILVKDVALSDNSAVFKQLQVSDLGTPGSQTGTISEVLVFPSALTLDRVSDVEEYLLRKFQITFEEFPMFSGSIMAYGGSVVPPGWLACDGAAVSRTTYADLFAALGETWGPGDGSTTFNVPDLRGRAPIGTGQGAGLTDRTLADTGGEEDHTLTIAELPAHDHDSGWDHDDTVGTEANQTVAGANNSPIPFGGVTAPKGGDDPHNNMQPFAAVRFIIKT